MTSTMTRRPGLVTFIGVLIYIQAAMAAVAAVVTITFSGSGRVQDAVDISTGGMILTGIWEAIIAVLLFVVAGGIMRGSRGIRMLVAIVIGIRMASAVALMMIYHTGGYLFNGLIAVLLGAFVLWALYGYEPSDDYFARQDGITGRPA